MASTTTKFEFFDRAIAVATEGLSQEAISAALAKMAKDELAKALRSGEGSPIYERYVNRVKDAPEESVSAPGPIVYEFVWWQAIINEALTGLREYSPRKSGRYQDSFIVLADQRLVTSYDDVSADAEIIITNVQPYTRKIHVGAMKMSVPPRLFERARQRMFRRFGQSFISVQVRFLNLPAGISPLVPYILKGHQRTIAAKAVRQSSAHRAGRTTLARRKDTEAGKPLTYPSLVINLVR
ncbi:hypothetical protein [Brucella anthropi]|uniref:hypothetical protein n=1 Tax=Brucella anthropi TaxID=529 RepID=UPI001E5B234A|nr:hypothetical protein [Brucella anthropi]UGQ24190.1 hypothetical protein LRL11_18310 [Brucella anthropi]